MVPLGSVITVRQSYGPDQVSRYNGYPSADMNGGSAPGVSSGDAQAIMQRIVTETLPNGIGYEWTDLTYQQILSGNTALYVFPLCVLLAFLVLAAQYESWSVPFAVLFGVPFGVLGALLGIYIRGQPNDIYFQVGLITVVGLAAKNAILIVEFANELRGRGVPVREAAVEAARERLRPILMTSFAFILGVLPLMLASCAGASSRHSIGTGVFSGMLFATTIGILFIPLFFGIVRSLAERASKRPKTAAAATVERA